jgi:aminoglycoside phosphotransferase (APT) family kinase protein
MRSPPHGFADDAEARRLHARPPAEALRWVETSLGVEVRQVRAYKGGTSSAIHRLRVQSRDGNRYGVVLRRYVREDLNAEEPDIAAREAQTLQLLDRVRVPTPALLAHDPTGVDAGVPTIVMTQLPGRLDWSPSDLEPWLRRLAAVLPQIHDAPLTAVDGLPEFTPYEPASWERPVWLANIRLWERAVEVFHGPRLDPDRVFIHRDYHPGNVLWRRQRVSGIVDWPVASIGPRAADVAHCRANLIGRFGLDVADRFLGLWQELSGAAYHPWAETVMLIDAMSWGAPRRRAERRDLESALAQRVAELAG